MSFFYHIFILGCITLFPVLGFNLVFGKTKILYFGQEGIHIIAAYILWVLVLQMSWSYPFAILAAAIVTIVSSWLLTKLALRLDEDAFGVMSIALHLIVMAIVLNWQSVTRGALGIPRIPRTPLPTSIEGFAIFIGIVALLWIFFIWKIDKGEIGRKMTALSEHPWHAQALGIDRAKIFLIGFLVAGVGAMLSAVIYPPYLVLLNPSDYHFPAMIFFATVVIAGGPGSMRGAIAATFGLTILREGIRFVSLPYDLIGPVRLLLFGLILFIAVYLRRDTLFPPERRV